MTTARFLVTAHQSLVISVKENQFKGDLLPAQLVEDFRQFIKELTAPDISCQGKLIGFITAFHAQFDEFWDKGRWQVIDAKVS